MPRASFSHPTGASDQELSSRVIPLLERALGRAQSTGRRILVTTSEPIPALDPLDVIDTEAALQTYWAVPSRDFAFVGAGSVAVFTGAGDTRFMQVGSEWARMQQEAVAERSQVSWATGPMVMGGFAFDPDGPRTALWNGFPAASFVVPQVLIIRRGDDCHLLLSAMTDGDSDPETIATELEAARDTVLARAGIPHGNAPHSGPLELPADPAAEDAWRAMVENAARAIRGGAMEKVVLARQVNARLPGRAPRFDARTALQHLQRTQPAAFVFGIWRDDAVLLGATPERLVNLRGREIETCVLAGSAARGSTATEDAAMSSGLRGSAKNREEHEIVRRDIHRALEEVCEGVTSALEPSILTLPAMHHLHTPVRARLAAGRTVFDVVARLHPTPALGGAPREPALRFIAEHEALDRGWYAAPIGWAMGDEAEFAVVLRAALIRGGRASMFAGCGIVAESDPDAEFAESALKLTTALNAVAAGAGSAGT